MQDGGDLEEGDAQVPAVHEPQGRIQSHAQVNQRAPGGALESSLRARAGAGADPGPRSVARTDGKNYVRSPRMHTHAIPPALEGITAALEDHAGSLSSHIQEDQTYKHVISN